MVGFRQDMIEIQSYLKDCVLRPDYAKMQILNRLDYVY